MAKVLKDFRCKVTKRLFRAGDQYDGDRLEELQALGYVAAEEAGDQAPKPKKQAKKSDSG
ncbi:MAG: hypothetical protein H0Z34_13425 [Brevibacillus sp.]|nr:hypothetical protein [Brevibacillus sp.]